MVTNKDVYRCYDKWLKKFLMNNGLPFLVVARDIKSNAVFWLFEKTDNCMRLIDEWEKNSPRK